MLEIEFMGPSIGKCDCCGGETTKLTRFITVDGEARGVYFAAFSHDDEDELVTVLLSLGEWWDGTDPAARVAFGMRIWTTEDHFQVGIIDAHEAGWSDAGLMGKRLGREDALAHPLVKEAFHVSDHIVAEDPEIRAYFGQGADAPN